MSAPEGIPPLPWRTDLTLEAGVVYDATGALVLVIDPMQEKTTDAQAHVIAAFVVEAVNRLHEQRSAAAAGVAALRELADIGEVPISTPADSFNVDAARAFQNKRESYLGRLKEYCERRQRRLHRDGRAVCANWALRDFLRLEGPTRVMSARRALAVCSTAYDDLPSERELVAWLRDYCRSNKAEVILKRQGREAWATAFSPRELASRPMQGQCLEAAKPALPQGMTL